MKYKPLRYPIIEIISNSTLYALRYTLGGHRPSQTSHLSCLLLVFPDIDTTGISRTPPKTYTEDSIYISPKYPRWLPKYILKKKTVKDCSKGSQGLSVWP
jgi:hypothetical protein